jgi:hypothetical protein
MRDAIGVRLEDRLQDFHFAMMDVTPHCETSERQEARNDETSKAAS